MIIQLIFFISLATFIFILARRYSPRTSYSIEEIKPVFGKGILSSLFSRVKVSSRSAAGRVPKFKSKPRHSSADTTSENELPQGSNGFWGNEDISEKTEISSHFEEGEELFNKGMYKEAEQFFLKAAASKPSDAKVYARLGLLYLEQKNYSDAIEALKVAVKLEKYNPSRHYNLALAYWGNKDTRRAIASVREAISLDPVTPKYRKLLEELLNG